MGELIPTAVRLIDLACDIGSDFSEWLVLLSSNDSVAVPLRVLSHILTFGDMISRTLLPRAARSVVSRVDRCETEFNRLVRP